MGNLYMCATPIGNLAEMTARGIEILKAADLICAEDTRHTLKLLNHFQIVAKKLISYHEHNKARQNEYILSTLAQGGEVVVVSDAGYPGISDPGEELVSLAVQRGFKVFTISGGNAALSALVASGLPTRTFYFAGFLPKTSKHRRQELQQLEKLDTTLIFYEAPHRLGETLRALLEQLGDRRIAVARELTKIHEEIFRGRISEALQWLAENGARGEFVLVVASAEISGLALESELPVVENSSADLEQLLTNYLAQGLDKKQAIAQIAKKLNIPKKVVYNTFINKEN